MRKQDIEELLHAKVVETTKEYEAAKLIFSHVCADVPSGIPHPDGARRLQKVAYAQTIALQNLAAAIHRFNAFLADGIIPEDLLDE
jgi:hypothetical protein